MPTIPRVDSRTAIERTRAFCDTLKGLLEAPANESLTPIVTSVTEAISRSCDDVILRLKPEVEALADAIDRIKLLSQSQLLQLEPNDERLLERLQQNRRERQDVIELLRSIQGIAQDSTRITPESLKGQAFIATSTACPDLPIDQPSSPPRLDTVSRSVESSPSRNLAESDAIPDARHGDRKSLSEAERQFLLAEDCRQQKDLTKAELLYSAVIRLDPSVVDAWVYRGRVRLLCGSPDAAIEDFSKALEMGSSDPLVACWRGDAYSFISKFALAIQDYSQALQLQQDLIIARYNRAVAFRLSGRLRTALTEFTLIVQREPNNGGAYLNRGMIHEMLGELGQAASEYRKAVRYLPNSREALQRLQAVRILIDDTEPVPEIPDAAGPASSQPPGASETVSTMATSTKSVAIVAQTSPTHEIATSPTAVSPPRREIQNHLGVECPSCLQPTSISWNKLQPGRVLSCPNCQRNFTLKPNGDLAEVVRGAAGRWTFRDKIIEAQREIRQWRINFACTIAIVVIVVGTIWWTPRINRQASVAEAQLPMDLESRVELFTQAWLHGDVRTMRRLTDPTQDRMLFLWCRHNPSPDQFDMTQPPKSDLRIEISKIAERPPLTWYHVKVLSPAAETKEPTVQLRLAWEERADSWFFQPATAG